MRKLFILASVFNLLASAATNYTYPISIGFWGSSTVGTTNFPLSTASNAALYGFQYTPPANVTLQNVSFEVEAVTGTLGATDVAVAVYSCTTSNSNSQIPNASLATSSTSSQHTAGFITYGGTGTGYNFALTGGTCYAFVMQNNNSTPTTNYPSVRYGSNLSTNSNYYNGACSICDWIIFTSTNTGGAWTTINQGFPFARLDFTDGSSVGTPVTAIVVDTVNRVQSAKEVGNMFTTQGVQMNNTGIQLTMQLAGSPTANYRVGLWTCNVGAGTCANQAYTYTYASTTATTTARNQFLKFSSTQTIPANTVTIITLAEASNSDSGSNYYALSEGYTVDGNTTCTGASSTTCSTQLKPLSGLSTVGAYCTGTCTTYSNWTQTTTTVYGMAMILASAGGEFTPIPVSAPIAH